MSEQRPRGRFGSLNELLRAKGRARRSSSMSAEAAAAPLKLRNDLAPSLNFVLRDPLRLTYPPANVRAIDPEHVKRVQKSITAFGCVAPVLIDTNDTVIEGVIRVEAARALRMEWIPCAVVNHLSPAQVKQFRVTANRLQERGSWDLELLRSVFEEMLEADFDMTVTGFTDDEIDLILQDDETGELVGNTEPDRSKPPITQPGDIVRLGPHLVLCGDARDERSYATIMGSKLARIVLTDQPFNVRVRGHVTKGAHREFAMASGEMTDHEFDQFNHCWISSSIPHLHDGGMLGTFIDWGGLPSVHAAAVGLGLAQINLIVWAKTNAGMGSLYRSQHELLPLFKKGTKPHVNNVNLGKNGRWRSNVWQYAGASSLGSEARQRLESHPTVKPTAMLEDALVDLTNRGDVVLDCFLGSGSTLIAAHRSGRVCRGVEIDAHYVDLVGRRFEALTGVQPVIEKRFDPVRR